MKKHLFFICPADYLEPIINQSFKDENYYFTSLGNSVKFHGETLYEIEHLIRKHEITEISFALSNNNPIIFDALGNQDFAEIGKLNDFYYKIIKQKVSSETSWQIYSQYLMLSYYLNDRIKELQFKLNGLLTEPIKINGKIYNRQKNVFIGIYYDLISKKYLVLN